MCRICVIQRQGLLGAWIFFLSFPNKAGCLGLGDGRLRCAVQLSLLQYYKLFERQALFLVLENTFSALESLPVALIAKALELERRWKGAALC